MSNQKSRPFLILGKKRNGAEIVNFREEKCRSPFYLFKKKLKIREYPSQTALPVRRATSHFPLPFFKKQKLFFGFFKYKVLVFKTEHSNLKLGGNYKKRKKNSGLLNLFVILKYIPSFSAIERGGGSAWIFVRSTGKKI